jgi:hypothetical protein
MQSLITAFLDYWPALLIFIGICHLIYLISEDYFECWLDGVFMRIVAIIGLLLWSGLGVFYFLYHPPLIWLWRLLPIAFGVSALTFAKEIFEEDPMRLIGVALGMLGLSVLFFLRDPNEANSVLDYWPALLVSIGIGHLYQLSSEDLEYDVFNLIGAIIGLLLWSGLGVVYFLYHPPLIWLWRLLPIAFGASFFAGHYYPMRVIGEAPIFFAVSALFFLYEPNEVWYWVRERELSHWILIHGQEVVKWLLTGSWYEVLIRSTGFIGAVIAVIKYLMWAISHVKD